MKDYNPKRYWNEKCRRYGRVGDIDNLLYAYVQPYRLKAIEKALARAKVQINKDTRILDVGCGTGDLISSFLKEKNFDITGIDFSEEAITYAKRRFSANKNVKLFVMQAENMDLPSSSFDLVTGIYILQHIVNKEKFFRAVENVVRVTRLKGHILVVDFAPIKVKVRKPRPYLIIRPREEYVRTFENNGCKLIYELGLFRIGVRTVKIIDKLLKVLRPHKKKINKEKIIIRNTSAKSTISRLYDLVRYIVLELAKPFDYLLLSYSFKYTDMRILIFKKIRE